MSKMKIASLVVLSFFLVMVGLSPSASADPIKNVDKLLDKSEWKEVKAEQKEYKSEQKENWKNGNYANTYVKNGTTYNGNSVPGPETFSVFLVGFVLLALWYKRHQRSSGG